MEPRLKELRDDHATKSLWRQWPVDSYGRVCTKRAVVETIEKIVTLMGLPIKDTDDNKLVWRSHSQGLSSPALGENWHCAANHHASRPVGISGDHGLCSRGPSRHSHKGLQAEGCTGSTYTPHLFFRSPMVSMFWYSHFNHQGACQAFNGYHSQVRRFHTCPISH